MTDVLIGFVLGFITGFAGILLLGWFYFEKRKGS